MQKDCNFAQIALTSGSIPSIVVEGGDQDGVAVENVQPVGSHVVGPSAQGHYLNGKKF